LAAGKVLRLAPAQRHWAPFLFFLVHDFGVNHAFVLFGVGLGRFAAWLVAGVALFRLGFGRGGFVKLGRDCLPDLVEFLAGGFDGGSVAAFQRIFHSAG